MPTLKGLDIKGLTKIVQRELPHVKNEGLSVWEGTIEKKEFIEILRAIRKDGCVEDALRLLGKSYGDPNLPMRTNVGYGIHKPNDRYSTKFEVVASERMGSMIQYSGCIFTYDGKGREVKQVTISNMILE